MTGDDDIFSLIENNNNKQLKLFVYNSEQDSCREVRLFGRCGLEAGRVKGVMGESDVTVVMGG